MSGGKRTNCAKCYKKLNSVGTCPNCGWTYGKEYGGQQTLTGQKYKKYYCSVHGQVGDPTCQECWDNLSQLVSDKGGIIVGP